MQLLCALVSVLLLTARAGGQTYNISTVAGGGLPATPMPALSAPVSPMSAALDRGGNLYFSSGQAVFKMDPSGTLTRVAGARGGGPLGDGGPATSARLRYPGGVAVDSAGNLYIADSGNQRIRKVTRGGTISTVAGNGMIGYSGDGGPATNAKLRFPVGVAVDAGGNLYFADSGNNRIRKVTPEGTISTVAGNGTRGYSGDGGPAIAARISYPLGIAVGSAGNIYIADGSNRIRKVGPDGTISTVAGSGTRGYSGDGGPATDAKLDQPTGAFVDSAGNLYIADTRNNRIRKVAAGGTISTVAGKGTSGYSGDGGLATNAEIFYPAAMALDSRGGLYIADTANNRIRKVGPGGTISTVAGNGQFEYAGDGGPAMNAKLNGPTGVAVDRAGNLYTADYFNGRVRKVAPNGTISTVAGNGTQGYSGDGGPATSAGFEGIKDIAVDSAGNLYIADGSNRIRKVVRDGTISTVAGNGGPLGYAGDGGPATSAKLGGPTGVAVDLSGNMYIADYVNNRIRKVTTRGIISTVAGNGTEGYSGDGGLAISAQFNRPSGIAVDSAGNLYVADSLNYRVRKVTPDGGISTVAGSGPFGDLGDGGPATSAHLSEPGALAVDSAGNLYISCPGRIRKVAPDGTISTIAGNGTPGYSGDGGPATEAQFDTPQGIAVDAAGRIYIADQGNDCVRVLIPVPAGRK